jgi:type I restriction enzyme M protein
VHLLRTGLTDLRSMETPFGKAVDPDDLDWFSGYDESKSLVSSMWSLMDHLRDYPIEEVGPHILFLLTLERHGYFEKVKGSKSITSLLQSKDVDSLPHCTVLRELSANGNLLLRHDTPEENRKVIAKVKEANTRAFSRQFPRLFDDLLHSMFSTNSKAGGSYLLTEHLRGLLSSVAKIPSGGKVFNPFAGLASFGLYLPEGTSYFGQEINEQAYDFARLRAVAHNVDLGGEFVIERQDTFTNWPSNSKFDVIISNPPFGIRLTKYGKEISSLRGAQNFLIKNGVELLKPKGKLVALVSEGFLFRGGTEQKTRQYLVENDLIETIIAIPQGMLNGTSIATAILVVNKDKKSRNRIKFSSPTAINIDNVGERMMFLGDIITELDQLDDPEFSPDSVFDRNMGLVTNDEIVKHNFNLVPKRYLLSEVTGTSLSKLLIPLSGTTIKGKYSGYLTTIKNLIAEESQEYRVSFPVLSEDDMATGQYILPRGTRKLDDSALLIAVAGRSLKPSYFSRIRKDGERFPLYLSPQIRAFKFDRSRLKRNYLIHQLRSELVKKQLKAYQTETGLPRLSVEDFLRIRIQLPSLEEQELTMRAFNTVNKKMEALVQERNALAHGATLERNTRFATLKHALGRPQQSILSAAKTIKGYLDHIGERGENLNNEYAEFFEQERNVSDTLQGIINDVDFISRLMDRGENGLQVDRYQLNDHSLTSVFKALKNLNTDGFKFKLKVRAEQTKEWDKLGVRINIQLLRVLLDNLLTNADKHGFEEKAPGNLVQITLSIIDYSLVVEIQNNGKPFPANFGKEQYVQEFKTISTDIGQGIGGHQVDQIANYFGDPEWDLITDANEIFPVTFIFRFPVSDTVATIDNDGKIHRHE